MPELVFNVIEHLYDKEDIHQRRLMLSLSKGALLEFKTDWNAYGDKPSGKIPHELLVNYAQKFVSFSVIVRVIGEFPNNAEQHDNFEKIAYHFSDFANRMRGFSHKLEHLHLGSSDEWLYEGVEKIFHDIDILINEIDSML